MVSNWAGLALGVEQGDPATILVVTQIITAYLVRARAFHLRDSWEDLSQDVLLALMRTARSGGLRAPEAFVGYVGAITRNKLNDRRDRDRLGAVASAPVPLPALLDAGGRDDDLRIDLNDALRDLDPRSRTVVRAIYFDGYSYEEAAERLGMPLGTLKRILTGALRAIRQRLVLVPEDRAPFPSSLPPIPPARVGAARGGPTAIR